MRSSPPAPAMTLIDVDGYLPPDELAVVGAAEAAKAVRRLDIGGSIGIDLPTSGGKAPRQAAAAAIDAHLPQPFERTAVNGFGFVQIVRPRRRASLVELAQDRAAFEARALLRRAAFERPGAKRLVAHPALIAVLERRADWTAALARKLGGAIALRGDPALTMSGGYVESV
jgi:ribonuclease G